MTSSRFVFSFLFTSSPLLPKMFLISSEEREKKEREYEQVYSRLRRLESLYSEKAEYLDKVKENYESLKFSDPEQALKVLEPLFKRAKIDFEKVHEEIVALVGGGDYKELLADALLDGIFFTFGHTEEKESIEKEYKELSQTLEKLKAEYMRNAKTEDSQKISNTYKRKEKVLEKNEFEEIRDELIKARLRLIII